MKSPIFGGLNRLTIGPVAGEPSIDLAVPETPVALRDVVAGAQDGDTESFEWLVREYQAELFRLAFRMLSNRGDAEDAVQEAFVLAWRRLPTLADPDAFHAWICQITTNLCLNRVRVRARRKTEVTSTGEIDGQARPAMSPADATEGPADRAQLSAQVRALERALATIPVDQRTSWVLKELHDLSYLEIANAVDAPVSTVRGRIARARQALATEMIQWRQAGPGPRAHPVVLPFEGGLRPIVGAC